MGYHLIFNFNCIKHDKLNLYNVLLKELFTLNNVSLFKNQFRRRSVVKSGFIKVHVTTTFSPTFPIIIEIMY